VFGTNDADEELKVPETLPVILCIVGDSSCGGRGG
jgi:hypothetical protein